MAEAACLLLPQLLQLRPWQQPQPRLCSPRPPPLPPASPAQGWGSPHTHHILASVHEQLAPRAGLQARLEMAFTILRLTAVHAHTHTHARIHAHPHAHKHMNLRVQALHPHLCALRSSMCAGLVKGHRPLRRGCPISRAQSLGGRLRVGRARRGGLRSAEGEGRVCAHVRACMRVPLSMQEGGPGGAPA